MNPAAAPDQAMAAARCTDVRCPHARPSDWHLHLDAPPPNLVRFPVVAVRRQLAPGQPPPLGGVREHHDGTELTGGDQPLSNRQAAEVLGVAEPTVRRDRASNDASRAMKPTSQQARIQEPERPASIDAPEPGLHGRG